MPLDEFSDDQKATTKNDLTGIIPKVDCHWRPKKSDDSQDGHGESPDRKAWEDEYARLTAYLETAYATDEGLEHADIEAYDEQHSVGQVLAHYDHDAETRRRTRLKARRDARRAAKLDGNLMLSASLSKGMDETEEDLAEEAEEPRGGDGVEGRAKEDAHTASRRMHVVRQAKDMGHPFSTLRASSSVGTWWPVNSHAKPYWGFSKYDQSHKTIAAVRTLPRAQHQIQPSSMPLTRPGDVAVRV